MSHTPAKEGKGVDRWADWNGLVDYSLCRIEKLSTLKVWLILFRHADFKTGFVCVGRGLLAKKADMAARSVDEGIDDLIRLGLLKQTRKGSPKTGPSQYKIRGAAR